MACELGAIVEGHGPAHFWRQGLEYCGDKFGDTICVFAFWPGDEDEAGLALVNGEDRLSVLGKGHKIGFPMARRVAVFGFGGPLCNCNAILEKAG